MPDYFSIDDLRAHPTHNVRLGTPHNTQRESVYHNSRGYKKTRDNDPTTDCATRDTIFLRTNMPSVQPKCYKQAPNILRLRCRYNSLHCTLHALPAAEKHKQRTLDTSELRLLHPLHNNSKPQNKPPTQSKASLQCSSLTPYSHAWLLLLNPTRHNEGALYTI